MTNGYKQVKDRIVNGEAGDPRGTVVITGWPETQLIACVECGSLLWDIDLHYETLHPETMYDSIVERRKK